MRNTYWQFIKMILGFLIISAFCVPVSLADDSGGHRKANQHQTRNGYENYPKVFDGRGTVDYRSAEKIVINDKEYNLSSGVTFNTHNQKNVSPELFEKDETVGFVENEKGEIESVWKLKKLSDLMPE